MIVHCRILGSGLQQFIKYLVHGRYKVDSRYIQEYRVDADSFHYIMKGIFSRVSLDPGNQSIPSSTLYEINNQCMLCAREVDRKSARLGIKTACNSDP